MTFCRTLINVHVIGYLSETRWSKIKVRARCEFRISFPNRLNCPVQLIDRSLNRSFKQIPPLYSAFRFNRNEITNGLFRIIDPSSVSTPVKYLARIIFSQPLLRWPRREAFYSRGGKTRRRNFFFERKFLTCHEHDVAKRSEKRVPSDQIRDTILRNGLGEGKEAA